MLVKRLCGFQVKMFVIKPSTDIALSYYDVNIYSVNVCVRSNIEYNYIWTRKNNNKTLRILNLNDYKQQLKRLERLSILNF